MVEGGGIFTCVRGKMPTSLDLARLLREYEEGVSPAAGTATRMGDIGFALVAELIWKRRKQASIARDVAGILVNL
jgi:hypothetical protein